MDVIRRWIAGIVDWAVISVFVVPFAVIGVDVLAGIVYFTLFEDAFGWSPGKFFADLRMSSATGGRAGFGRAAGRAALAWGLPTLISDVVAHLVPDDVANIAMLAVLGLCA